MEFQRILELKVIISYFLLVLSKSLVGSLLVVALFVCSRPLIIEIQYAKELIEYKINFYG